MKRLLLDTHTFLWWVDDAPELSAKARRVIADAKNECYLSTASVWEIAIKASVGKLRLTQSVFKYVPEHVAANGFVQLGIDFRHAARVETLTFHHRDPFDRLLVAQALEEDIDVVTRDKVFENYGVRRIW